MRSEENEIRLSYQKGIFALADKMIETAEKLSHGGQETAEDRADLYVAFSVLLNELVKGLQDDD